MPSNRALLKAYDNILIPGRIDEMTYEEANTREAVDRYTIRQALLRLYERDCAEIIRDARPGE